MTRSVSPDRFDHVDTGDPHTRFAPNRHAHELNSNASGKVNAGRQPVGLRPEAIERSLGNPVMPAAMHNPTYC
jgi:hypothetical protein